MRSRQHHHQLKEMMLYCYRSIKELRRDGVNVNVGRSHRLAFVIPDFDASERVFCAVPIIIVKEFNFTALTVDISSDTAASLILFDAFQFSISQSVRRLASSPGSAETAFCRGFQGLDKPPRDPGSEDPATWNCGV